MNELSTFFRPTPVDSPACNNGCIAIRRVSGDHQRSQTWSGFLDNQHRLPTALYRSKHHLPQRMCNRRARIRSRVWYPLVDRWLKQMISSAGRLSCRLSPTAHGSISICLVSTISQMTSWKTQWESSPKIGRLNWPDNWWVPRRHNSFAHKRFNKFSCRFSYLLTTVRRR